MTFASEMPAMSFEKAAQELQIPLHVLHFWIKKFPCFTEQKASKGKTEEFSHRDLLIARGLHRLLFIEKKTIKVVQALIAEKGVHHLIGLTLSDAQSSVSSSSDTTLTPLSVSDSSIEEAKNHLASSGIVEKMRHMISNVDDFVHNVTSFDEKHNELQGNRYDDIEEGEEYLPAEPPAQYRRDKPESVSENDGVIPKKPTSRKKPIKDMRSALQKKVEIAKEKPAEIEIQDSTDNETETANSESVLPSTSPARNTDGEILKNTLLKIDLLRKDLQNTQKVVAEVLKAMGYSGFTNAYDDYDRLNTDDNLPVQGRKK